MNQALHFSNSRQVVGRMLPPAEVTFAEFMSSDVAYLLGHFNISNPHCKTQILLLTPAVSKFLRHFASFN